MSIQAKWEIEPHPYDLDCDILVTDNADVALTAFMYLAESVWDAIEAGQEVSIKIRRNA